ncbi:hypothetical protein D3C85_1600660 [compost metagenome]
MEITPARKQRHRLFPGVNQLGVFLAWRRGGPHTENTVFAVQENLAVFWQIVGNLGRHADAQIDVRALGNIPRNALGELLMR